MTNTLEKRWIDHFQSVVFKYNPTKHSAIKHSSFFLFHGHQCFNNYQPVAEKGDMDLKESDNYEQWAFEDIFEATENIEQKLGFDVLNHFTRYRAAMISQLNIPT